MEPKKIKVCCVASVDITLKFMLFNQLKFLQSQGYEVSAVCSPGKWLKGIEKEGIRVKTIGFKRKMSLFSDIVSFFCLYSYFKKEKFHIVHTHTLKPEFYGQIAAKLAGVPIIINTLHGFDFTEDAPFLEKKFFLLLEKIAAKCSDLIFSISKKIIDIAIEEKICEPHLIKYLGRDIDIERFDPNRFNDKFILKKKRELGISAKKKIVGIVARLVVEKGYLDLFSAFKIILNKFPDTVLLIIGQEEPEKRDALQKDIVKNYGIENNVIFLGERTDVEELYSLMDVFILPSYREGIGASILEASAMERPVIATNVGGCSEAVDDGKTGVLVPVKNPGKLAKAIIYILSNPLEAKKMGRAGRKKIIKEFEKSLVFERLNKGYNNLITKLK
jgi:glycosyltransferase involved in cell wall biosynthesis